MEPWEGSTPPAMSSGWRSQPALTRSLWAQDLTESYWMVCATINYRDTPSQVSIPEGTGTPAPGRSCGGFSGCGSRSRSKLVNRATNSGFHRRSFSISQDTLSRRHLAIHLSKSFRSFSTPDPFSPRRMECVRFRHSMILDSVERKGFEPSTPGLQSRCSPS